MWLEFRNSDLLQLVDWHGTYLGRHLIQVAELTLAQGTDIELNMNAQSHSYSHDLTDRPDHPLMGRYVVAAMAEKSFHFITTGLVFFPAGLDSSNPI